MTDDCLPANNDNSNSPQPNPARQAPIVYQSADLLQGRREAWIEHAGELYRLRLTSQGKLHLTK